MRHVCLAGQLSEVAGLALLLCVAWAEAMHRMHHMHRMALAGARGHFQVWGPQHAAAGGYALLA